MAEPTVFLEHRVTGARYVYCPILASHPDMVRVIVDDEQPQAEVKAAAAAPRQRKAAAPKPVLQEEVVVDPAPATEPPVNADGYDD